MEYVLVSIKDNAIQAFGAINTVRATGEALRSFMDAVNDKQNKQLNQHPEDYDLYQVGKFDDNNGSISNEVKLLSRGVEVKIKE